MMVLMLMLMLMLDDDCVRTYVFNDFELLAVEPLVVDQLLQNGTALLYRSLLADCCYCW